MLNWQYYAISISSINSTPTVCFLDKNNIFTSVCQTSPSPTHNLQGVHVNQNHGELDYFMVVVRWVILLTRCLEIHHTDVVVVLITVPTCSRKHQFLLFVVVFEAFPQYILNTPWKNKANLITQGVIKSRQLKTM